MTNLQSFFKIGTIVEDLSPHKQRDKVAAKSLKQRPRTVLSLFNFLISIKLLKHVVLFSLSLAIVGLCNYVKKLTRNTYLPTYLLQESNLQLLNMMMMIVII